MPHVSGFGTGLHLADPRGTFFTALTRAAAAASSGHREICLRKDPYGKEVLEEDLSLP